MKIVLIDDSDLDLLINEKLILNAFPNWSLKVYSHGHVMINAVKEAGENNLPDLIISDLRMPGLSGADIVLEYFALFPHSTTKILLLSATVQYEEEKLAEKLGDRVRIMEKPLDPMVLTEL